MTPERFKKINSLADSVLELSEPERAAYLERVCAGDAELRRAVEELLASHDSLAGFLAQPALEALARDLAIERDANSLAGRVVAGRYEIISRLGAGGVGEVWLARDSQLGRDVAVKLLSPLFAGDPTHISRFRQEARAASTLNHPNIVTIYDMGRAEEGEYIAQELVSGQTLRRLLAAGPLPLKTALDIGGQTAAALGAVHSAGIAHRDIKPENIMIRPDGLVKVLDFGLARIVEPGTGDLAGDALTAPGVALGTVKYMSPEQARGLHTDVRSDVFSLGVVLYEMLAGAPPFAGPSTADVLAAILTERPDPLSWRVPGAPPAIERIVARCLEKNREDRYASANVLLGELESLQHHAGPAGRRRYWVTAAAIALVAAGITGTWIITTRTRQAPQYQRVRLTSFGPEMPVSATAISPDGRFVAYANPGGIFVEQPATGETRRVPAPSAKFQTTSLAWLHNGTRLLVDGLTSDAGLPGLWFVPVFAGGTPLKLGDYPPAVPSPDDSHLAIKIADGEGPRIDLIDSDGGERRTLVHGSAGEMFGEPAWSADGRELCFVRFRWDAQMRHNNGSIDCHNLAQGRTASVLTGSDFTGDVAALARGRLVYARLRGANPSAFYGADLLETRAVPAEPSIIAQWQEPVAGLSASASGDRLALRTVVVQHNVYTADLGAGFEPRRLTFGIGREDIPRAWTPDGRSVVFDSNRDGNWKIFRQPLDGGSEEPLVETGADTFAPRVSPDGAWLLYLERPTNWKEPQPVRLMRVPLVGGLPQVVLTAAACSAYGLRFDCPQRPGSPCLLAQQDHAHVRFRAFDPLRGFTADPGPVAPVSAIHWGVSPDGSRLAWAEQGRPEVTIHVVSLARHPAASIDVQLAGLSQLTAMHWAPSGKGWFVVVRSPAGWKLLEADPNGRTRVLLQGTGEFIPDVFPSPDGRHLALGMETSTSNVWLLNRSSK